jgi:hypothetical protein
MSACGVVTTTSLSIVSRTTDASGSVRDSDRIGSVSFSRTVRKAYPLVSVGPKVGQKVRIKSSRGGGASFFGALVVEEGGCAAVVVAVAVAVAPGGIVAAARGAAGFGGAAMDASEVDGDGDGDGDANPDGVGAGASFAVEAGGDAVAAVGVIVTVGAAAAAAAGGGGGASGVLNPRTKMMVAMTRLTAMGAATIIHCFTRGRWRADPVSATPASEHARSSEGEFEKGMAERAEAMSGAAAGSMRATSDMASGSVDGGAACGGGCPVRVRAWRRFIGAVPPLPPISWCCVVPNAASLTVSPGAGVAVEARIRPDEPRSRPARSISSVVCASASSTLSMR